jgi:S-DNA-T family DNA segregation ATPase FtsK/SpoIIIE
VLSVVIDVLPPAESRVALPRPPEVAPRHPFPLLASLAPLVGSVVIWAITSSPFALVFAFLGPVIAVASMGDARLQGRRARRRESARFRDELDRARESITTAHGAEVAVLLRAAPGALAILVAPIRDPERWLIAAGQPVVVSLGSGRQRSAVRLDGDIDDGELRALADTAGTVIAPIVVDARLGIGVCGVDAVVRPVVRGLALQVANRLAPEHGTWAADEREAAWLHELPHPCHGRAVSAITWAEGPERITVAFAETAALLPHGCRVVLEVGASGTARVVTHPRPELLVEVAPEFVSLAQATEAAEFLALAAAGRGDGVRGLPASVGLADLAGVRAEGRLGAAFLVGSGGAVTLDLVGDGPHAVVAGTTGSGKSELLLSWLLAMAHDHGPEEVNFLLVDFKGGASFGPLMGLPHVVGLVTDLDETTARRALLSLRAEVRLRERMLSDSAARSIDELPNSARPPRLVIVVDEFAALVGGFDDLHSLFADLAARGRSLGVHLILCTQRPAGVVRDSVLANVPLRLSLRVTNRADSVAVIGTDAAAVLPTEPAGRAVLALAGADPVVVQVAMAGAENVESATARWSGAEQPRRPWCDELPVVLSPDELPEVPGGFAFGLADRPEEQRQAPAVWTPAIDGNLLVLGGNGSGKSTALSALCRSADAVRVPAHVEGAWDAVESTVEELRRGTARPGILVLDDIDVMIARFGDDHRQAFVESVVELLRTGSSAGLHLALGARRLSPALQAIASSCDCRLVLRMPDRQERIIAGGDPALHSPEAPPGRGEWRGAVIQVADSGTQAEPHSGPDPVFDPTRWPLTLVVTARPGEVEERLSGAADTVQLRTVPSAELRIRETGRPMVLIGDVEAWHAEWGRLTALRPSAAMLFDRCTVADFRALSGRRSLPPAMAMHTESAWLQSPEGALGRVLLPRPARSPAA